MRDYGARISAMTSQTTSLRSIGSSRPIPRVVGTTPRPAPSEAAPIFIVGLPRSGSTLVERILGSHSKVRMGGELPQFALSVVAAVNRGSHLAQLTRQQLIAPIRAWLTSQRWAGIT